MKKKYGTIRSCQVFDVLMWGRCIVSVLLLLPLLLLFALLLRKMCLTRKLKSNWRIQNEHTHTRPPKCIINFIECTLNMHLCGRHQPYQSHKNANINNDGHAELYKVDNFFDRFLVFIHVFFSGFSLKENLHKLIYPFSHTYSWTHDMGNKRAKEQMKAQNYTSAIAYMRYCNASPIRFIWTNLWHSFV